MAMKRILVPVDFSEDSLVALDYARDFAKQFGSELLILHVVEPIYYATPADMFATTPNVAMLLEDQRRMANEHLTRMRNDLEKKGLRCRAVVKTGSPAQVIVDTASSAKADLVAMSTHGRTGLVHMLMGSVAEKVVRNCASPVLTVRGGARKKGKSRPKTKKRAKK